MNNFGIGTLACYTNTEQIGEGTYGYVYKAIDKRSDKVVALKRLILHKESHGFPLCAIREIKVLKLLSHKNIIKLNEIITSKGCEHIEKNIITTSNRNNDTDEKKKRTLDDLYNISSMCGNIYFVFDYYSHDLSGLLTYNYKFTIKEIKCIVRQLFNGLEYLHSNNILHRDLKPANILINNYHEIKIADFGLARIINDRELRMHDLTNNVITMWYKPPELLLGAVRYTTAIDIWSAGCIVAELELGRPIFPGRTEIEEFDLICRNIGSPTEVTWPDMGTYPNSNSILTNTQQTYTTTLKITQYNKLKEITIQLLERILVFDPSRRSSAKLLLTHKYFTSYPAAVNDPKELEPLHVEEGMSFHEFQTKKNKKLQSMVNNNNCNNNSSIDNTLCDGGKI